MSESSGIGKRSLPIQCSAYPEGRQSGVLHSGQEPASAVALR